MAWSRKSVQNGRKLGLFERGGWIWKSEEPNDRYKGRVESCVAESKGGFYCCTVTRDRQWAEKWKKAQIRGSIVRNV